MIKWTSTKEKLPELYQEVLVRDGTHITTGYLEKTVEKIVWKVSQFDTFLGFDIKNIKDWRTK